VDIAFQNNGRRLELAEAISVLLQTWNRAYYQYRPFTEEHFLEIEAVLNSSLDDLIKLRRRSIESITQLDKPKVAELFGRFANVLGPVGAAKSLHLLAPDFFPLWDDEISKKYKVKKDGEGYFQFMMKTLDQINSIGGRDAINNLPGVSKNALKAIDEYNYIRITIPKRDKTKKQTKK
jgi:hypothetical protein